MLLQPALCIVITHAGKTAAQNTEASSTYQNACSKHWYDCSWLLSSRM